MSAGMLALAYLQQIVLPSHLQRCFTVIQLLPTKPPTAVVLLVPTDSCSRWWQEGSHLQS